MRVRLYVQPTQQFATISVSMFWTTPLNEHTVTPYAIIPFVIRRGSEAYPETAELRQQYEWRYGLRSNFELQKRGNAHVWQAQLNAVAPAFTSDPTYQFEESLAFWWNHILYPARNLGTEEAFRADYVEQEKQTIQRRIASQKNDPISYAYDQTVRHVLRQQPHHMSIWGEEEALAQWDHRALWTAYQTLKAEAQLDLYIQGDVDVAACAAVFAKDAEVQIHTQPDPILQTWTNLKEETIGDTQIIWEEATGEQVKLNMGYRLPVRRSSSTYPAALMLNGVLGGYAHSKLFQHVREKASLAYYASSRLDILTGSLFVQTGVAPAQEARARALIEDQIRAMQDGEIADDEWHQTIALLTHYLREREDDPSTWGDAMQSNAYSGSAWTLESLLNGLTTVTKDDVKQLAAQLRLDTVYRYGPKHPEQAGNEEVETHESINHS